MNIIACLDSEFEVCPFTVTKYHHFEIKESFKVKRLRNHQEKILILNVELDNIEPQKVILLHTHNYKKNLLIDAETKTPIGLIDNKNAFYCQLI